MPEGTSRQTSNNDCEKVTPKKKTFERRYHNLGDGAEVTHILSYVNDPDGLFTELKANIPWEQKTYEVQGMDVISPRLIHVMDCADEELSKLPILKRTKQRLEKLIKVTFRYAVLNYYRDGNDHVGYHSDREVKEGQTVVSVSVGATRRFALKHRYHKDTRHVFMLAHGDILILNDNAIKFKYLHHVPRMTNVGPRINVTFRE